MTSRSSRQLEKESKVFFMVLIATFDASAGYERELRASYCTYQCPATGNVSASSSNACECNAAKATVTYLFHHFIPLLKGGPPMGQFP